MIRQSSQPFVIWFHVTDLSCTGVAWVGAYVVRFSGWIPITKPQPEFVLYLQNLPLILLLAAVAFHVAGQYRIHRLRRFREEFVAVVEGSALLALFVMAARFYQHEYYESRAAMAMFTVLTPASILIARRLSWNALKSLRRRGYNQTNAIIVGTGRVARKTMRALRRASWMGIRTVGFIEDQPNRWCSDLNVIGTTEELPEIVTKNQVEHVFIALPLNRYGEARRVFDALSQTYAEIRLVVDTPEISGLSLTTSNLYGLPIVGLRESAHFGLNLHIKRVMDVTLSAIGLVILTPLFGVLAWLVKWSSPGPIFYRQERCGLSGRPFGMLKFRTMPVDAETSSGPVWTIKNDPRRTRIGTFLRKTSLDELPQLINVLMGDMSLVGPRPERPHFIKRFEKTIPNYMARHKVKAGITGWAQVHGWRGNTSLRKRVQYDLQYITHWTPWLDVKILFMTLIRINKNAY
jgi:Undecaprenyl-phosphate glucose phosphotransferase